MGLFDFVKDAGEKLFQGKAKSDDGPSPEKAAALKKVVGDFGLGIEGLDVAVAGPVATIRGTAASQADREKAVLLVGNTAGIAQVDDQMTVKPAAKAAPAEPPATLYCVASGDSLSKIAKKHYGNAGAYMKIFEANQPMLKDPNKIYPGQVLRIPPK